MAGTLPTGDYVALPKRGLTEETCRRAGYWVGKFNGKPVQVADILDPITRAVNAQKVRFPDKDFLFLGESDDFYLEHLWRDGGKRIVITEGEVDANTIFQVQGYKWPVVSITKGCNGAKKQFQKKLKFLLLFDEVVINFDNDDPGNAAAIECAMVLPPGRAKIARFPLKDANEMHVAGRDGEIISCLWEAKSYRPDGIVTLSDLRERILTPPEEGLPWWDERLTKLTYGRRLGETYCFGAGTGVGKTDWFTEQMIFDMTKLGEKVAVFALEQMPEETGIRLIGKHAGKRFHIPDGSWTQDEKVKALGEVEASGKLFLYDNFGATDWDVIQNTIRHLAHGEGVRLFYLDHLTALCADAENDLDALKKIMAEMAKLAKELRIIIHFISHLSRPKEGKAHEEGGRVMIRHFYGASAIGFWSHFMFGLERDQQSEDPEIKSITTFRCLKDRYTGNATGEVIHYGYDKSAGRLIHSGPPPKETTHGFNKPERDNDDF